MADEGPDRAFAELDAKLRKARSGKHGGGGAEGAGPSQRLNFGSGLQAGIELLAGVAFGLGVGWLLDSWLDTRPILLIVMFVLGSAAGMLNAFRYLGRLNAADQSEGTDRKGA